MIRYSLVCKSKHRFDIWFANSADYDKQTKRGLVTCPECGSPKVEKALMAPALGRSAKKRTRTPVAAEAPAETAPPSAESKAPVAVLSPQQREFHAKLKELRDHLIKNSENVGERFPEEARKMHYGEADRRSIYGEATLQEAKDLLEEGVELHPLPVLPEDRD